MKEYQEAYAWTPMVMDLVESIETTQIGKEEDTQQILQQDARTKAKYVAYQYRKMNNKKAELSINLIVIAAIAMIILVILAVLVGVSRSKLVEGCHSWLQIGVGAVTGIAMGVVFYTMDRHLYHRP